MSIEAMAWAMEQEAPSARTKFLLIMLSDGADMDGNCAVHLEHLARVTQMKPEEVAHGINILHQAQLILRDPQFRLPLADLFPDDIEIVRLPLALEQAA